MACSKPAEVFEGLEDMLSCSMCLEQFNQPRSLPCLHVYCTGCLGQLIQRSDSPGILLCPSCRAEVRIPRGGAADFPTSFLINSLGEAVSKIKKLGLNQAPKCTLCADVNEDTSAEMFCVECMKTMCGECLRRHNQFTKNHTLLPSENLQFDQLNTILQNRTMTCQEHGEHVKVYCETCQQFACLMCTAVGHEGHTKKPINEVLEEAQAILKQYLEKYEQCEQEYDKQIGTVDKARKDSGKMAKQHKAELRRHGDDIIKKVNAFVDQEQEKIETENATFWATLDSLKDALNQQTSQVKHIRQSIENSLNHGGYADVIHASKHDTQSYDELLQDLKYNDGIPALNIQLKLRNLNQIKVDDIVGEVKCCIIQKPDSRIHTEASNVNVNRDGPTAPKRKYIPDHVLSVSSCTATAKKINQFALSFNPSDIACSSEEHYTVCSYRSSTVKTFTQDGQELHTMKTPADTKAVGLAVTAHNVYATDKNAGNVLVFDKQGKYIKSLQVGFKGDGCVAISGSTLYVTSEDDHTVYCRDLPNGTNKRVFASGRDVINKPFGIAVNNTHVAVSSFANNNVTVLDKSGRQVYKYVAKGTAAELHQPWGVAFDAAGRLFVCDHSNHRICIISQQGQHMGIIDLKKDGMPRPEGITVNNQGDIVVTCIDPDMIVVYRYTFQ